MSRNPDMISIREWNAPFLRYFPHREEFKRINDASIMFMQKNLEVRRKGVRITRLWEDDNFNVTSTRVKYDSFDELPYDYRIPLGRNFSPTYQMKTKVSTMKKERNLLKKLKGKVKKAKSRGNSPKKILEQIISLENSLKNEEFVKRRRVFVLPNKSSVGSFVCKVEYVHELFYEDEEIRFFDTNIHPIVINWSEKEEELLRKVNLFLPKSWDDVKLQGVSYDIENPYVVEDKNGIAYELPSEEYCSRSYIGIGIKLENKPPQVLLSPIKELERSQRLCEELLFHEQSVVFGYGEGDEKCVEWLLKRCRTREYDVSGYDEQIKIDLWNDYGLQKKQNGSLSKASLQFLIRKELNIAMPKHPLATIMAWGTKVVSLLKKNYLVEDVLAPLALGLYAIECVNAGDSSLTSEERIAIKKRIQKEFCLEK